MGTRRGDPGRGLLGTPVAELASTLSMIMDPRLEVEAGRPSTGCKGGGERACKCNENGGGGGGGSRSQQQTSSIAAA